MLFAQCHAAGKGVPASPPTALTSVLLPLEHTDLKTADGRGGASPPKATQANLGLEIRVLTIH